MPELPEVETTVKSLKKEVLGRTFVRVWEENNSILKKANNRTVKDIIRKGKNIVFVFDNNLGMFVHLRMTGHFLIGKWNMVSEVWRSNKKILQDKKNGYIRVMFFLDNGKQLALSDQRKFADIYVAPLKDINKYLASLGPEILLVKEDEFVSMIKGKSREIKPLLMDQYFISGVGNIYASDSLFLAGVHPRKNSKLLTDKQIKKIHSSLHKVLKKSLLLQGDSTSDFRLIDGGWGGYQKHHLVYNRDGEKCVNCSDIIKKIKVGGRGTYFCPSCQPKNL